MRRLMLVIPALMLLAPPIGAADDAKKVLEKMQGDWAVVSIEDDGANLPEAEAAKYSITIKDDKFVINGPDKKESMTIKLDPTKKPAEIDLLHDDPQKKGMKVLGIYELGDGALKIAGRDKGDMRPTEFKSSKDVSVVVLKRKA
jgi:uncharacterized protein (TIGR03067 family)